MYNKYNLGVLSVNVLDLTFRSKEISRPQIKVSDVKAKSLY